MKKDLQRQINRLRIATWVLTLGYAAIAISVILLVYGNPELVSTTEQKLQCSSEVNPNCEVFIPKETK